MNNTYLIKQNFNLRNENKILKNKLNKTQNLLSFANKKISQLEKKIEEFERNQERLINETIERVTKEVTEKLEKEHKKEVDELKGKISRLEIRLNTDSSNSGTPTTKDRIGTHKVQNNREKTDRSIGAQDGHEIHKLDYFKDEEITNIIEHTLEKCPHCGGELEEINVVKSDIIDIETKITKTRNNIHNYKCSLCKKRVSANNSLPRGTTYGDNINAIALSMMNEANTPLNKISMFISGITNNEVNLCDGYLIKLQKRCADKLENFIHSLKDKVISLDHVFWDDTVVKMGLLESEEGFDEKDLEYLEKIENNKEKKDNKIRNGIIRFYGDNRWALLLGHRTKDMKSIDDDGILDKLSENCVVMHDHVLLNYNDKYCFKNAECNEHTKRNLNKITDMFPNHKWAGDMRKFLININKEKQSLIKQNINNFSDERIKQIFEEYDKFIKDGYKDNDAVDLAYILNKNDELNLIERLDRYKENHLMFATDFSVDFTNNTSEKGLRQVKRKLAVSFMFKNANRMKDYATLLSYLETCYRNGVSRFEASKRLVSNNPYTVKEISELILSQEPTATA